METELQLLTDYKTETTTVHDFDITVMTDDIVITEYKTINEYKTTSTTNRATYGTVNAYTASPEWILPNSDC